MIQDVDTFPILLVEDNAGDARLIQEMLYDAHRSGLVPSYKLTVVNTLQEGLAKLKAQNFSVLLLDLTLPDSRGLMTLQKVVERVQNVPILVLTGYGDHELALEAIQEGAQDYLIKGKFNGDSLGRAIRYGIMRQTLVHDLQQKHAELKASEERRYALFEKSTDGIVLVRDDRTVCYANTAAQHMLSSQHESILGKQWLFSSQPGAIEEIELTFTVGETTILEMRIDETEWQKERVSLIHLRDVTRQKMAEMAHRESEERLRSTIDSMDDLVFILDKDGRFLSYAPPMPHNRFRGTPSFIIGKTYDFVLPEACHKKLAEAIESVKHSDWVQQFDYALEIPSQSYWFSAKVSARYDTNGAYNGATIVIRDITQLKRAEENYRRKNVQLEHLRTLSLELSLELSLDELVQTVSYRAVELMEARGSAVYLLDENEDHLDEIYTAGYPLQMDKKQFSRGEDLPGVIWETNQAIHIEDYQSWPHGNWETPLADNIEILGAPIRWQNEFLGVLLIFANYEQNFQQQDIQLLNLFVAQAAIALQNARMHMQLQAYSNELAERVELRTQELREAYEQLRSFDKLKSKFLSDVSHELRTPTTNLKLYLTLLQKGSADKAEKYMQVLEAETDRLELLIESILQLSQLDTRSTDEHFMPIALQDVVRRVLQGVRPLATEKGLFLKVEESQEQLQVMGSPDQLLKAIMHLLRNAIMYTESGGVTLTLTHANNQAALQVQDTGIGIAPDELAHVIDRFYRGNRVSQSTLPGIGLGLSIVKAIVDMHGGSIDIESEVQKGTKVSITLPLLASVSNGGATRARRRQASPVSVHP